jgi:hypothetical protein
MSGVSPIAAMLFASREAFPEMQSACVEFHQERDQVSSRATLVVDSTLNACQEILIGDLAQSRRNICHHASRIARAEFLRSLRKIGLRPSEVDGSLPYAKTYAWVRLDRTRVG